MESGYMVDVTYGHGTSSVPNWVGGEPQRSIWTGLKLRGKEQLAVTTYRCGRCGYLESYGDRA
jgi:hypothetical protein